MAGATSFINIHSIEMFKFHLGCVEVVYFPFCFAFCFFLVAKNHFHNGARHLLPVGWTIVIP